MLSSAYNGIQTVIFKLILFHKSGRGEFWHNFIGLVYWSFEFVSQIFAIVISLYIIDVIFKHFKCTWYVPKLVYRQLEL